MKKIIEVSKEDSGLMSLLGEEVTFFCINYIYAGKLIGVNETCVELENAKLVYDTGAFDKSTWQDAQPITKHSYFVTTASIESFGRVKE